MACWQGREGAPCLSAIARAEETGSCRDAGGRKAATAISRQGKMAAKQGLQAALAGRPCQSTVHAVQEHLVLSQGNGSTSILRQCDSGQSRILRYLQLDPGCAAIPGPQ